MAAVIGDLVPDVSRLRDLIVKPSSLQHQHQHQRSPSRSRGAAEPRRSASRPHRRQDLDPKHALASAGPLPAPAAASSCVAGQSNDSSSSSSSLNDDDDDDDDDDENNNGDDGHGHGHATRPTQAAHGPLTRATSQRPAHDPCAPIPSPPPSSSPAAAADDEKCAAPMASKTQGAPPPRAPPSDAAAAALSAPLTRDRRQRHPLEPSPPADDFRIPVRHDAHLVVGPDSLTALSPPPPSPDQQQQQPPPPPPPQVVVHVRDLAHVHTLASTHALGGAAGPGSGPGNVAAAAGPQTKYEISGMPMADVIEMVAALLTKITSTNDLQHDATQRNAAHQQQASQSADGSPMSSLSHSVLAFHGKNVPAISILSYLSRIHKYCPTTYEVFLSLLVYFDRMTERVNDSILRSDAAPSPAAATPPALHHDTLMADPGPDLARHPDAAAADWDLADDQDLTDDDPPAAPRPVTYFVVDSFNIHRLIIAGVTCASKFFSDVFYTNSRYAKVGGLPLAELNHLEIQFLVLNDFRLAVPVEDLEAYATMLVEFYAREVIAHKAGSEAGA
ncbi:hypothetical protein CDD83_10133 [Cordyceps sp. RAO-2017]|nr:hypothetical protein CDD83_10133 [Cordyceps sp. RAO-2017]